MNSKPQQLSYAKPDGLDKTAAVRTRPRSRVTAHASTAENTGFDTNSRNAKWPIADCTREAPRFECAESSAKHRTRPLDAFGSFFPFVESSTPHRLHVGRATSPFNANTSSANEFSPDTSQVRREARDGGIQLRALNRERLIPAPRASTSYLRRTHDTQPRRPVTMNRAPGALQQHPRQRSRSAVAGDLHGRLRAG